MMIGLQAYNIKVTIRLGVNDDLFDLADPRCTQNLQKHKICKIKIVEKGKTTFSLWLSLLVMAIIISMRVTHRDNGDAGSETEIERNTLYTGPEIIFDKYNVPRYIAMLVLSMVMMFCPQKSKITATINTETDCATAHSPPAQVTTIREKSSLIYYWTKITVWETMVRYEVC